MQVRLLGVDGARSGATYRERELKVVVEGGFNAIIRSAFGHFDEAEGPSRQGDRVGNLPKRVLHFLRWRRIGVRFDNAAQFIG